MLYERSARRLRVRARRADPEPRPRKMNEALGRGRGRSRRLAPRGTSCPAMLQLLAARVPPGRRPRDPPREELLEAFHTGSARAGRCSTRQATVANAHLPPPRDRRAARRVARDQPRAGGRGQKTDWSLAQVTALTAALDEAGRRKLIEAVRGTSPMLADIAARSVTGAEVVARRPTPRALATNRAGALLNLAAGPRRTAASGSGERLLNPPSNPRAGSRGRKGRRPLHAGARRAHRAYPRTRAAAAGGPARQDSLHRTAAGRSPYAGMTQSPPPKGASMKVAVLMGGRS